jgi:hypothetical protein
MEKLGEEYKLTILREFGSNLASHARGFDVANMRLTSDSFPGLIKEMKRMTNEE